MTQGKDEIENEIFPEYVPRIRVVARGYCEKCRLVGCDDVVKFLF